MRGAEIPGWGWVFLRFRGDAGAPMPVGTTVPIHVLKEYAGHADIATTARYDLKTSADDAKKVRAALSVA